jgi:molybdenum cofactor biosynthesis enzyme MoaA
MSLSETSNEIELIVTYKCNWHCDFCCIDTHSKKPLSFEEIKEKLKLIRYNYNNYNITISGGEPGLLPEETIKYILEDLKEYSKSISLNTNGVFLEKYLKFAKYFDYVLYHCSEDLTKNPNYEIVEEWKKAGVKVDYMIVIDDKNFKNFDRFMKQNQHIPINVVAATKADGGLDSVLSNRNRWKLLTSVKKYKNITKESLKRLIKEKDFGNIIYI